MIELDLEARIVLELVDDNQVKARFQYDFPGIGWAEGKNATFDLVVGDTVCLRGMHSKLSVLELTKVPDEQVPA